MAGILQPWITRHVGPDGRRCKPGESGAKKVRVQTKTWYAQGVPGTTGRIALRTKNKSIAQQKLGELLKEAGQREAGTFNPCREHQGKPIAEHVADFDAELRIGRTGKRRQPPTERHVRKVLLHIRAVLAGCGFRLAEQIEYARVQRFLHGLTLASSVPELPRNKEWFTASEIAVVLGVKTDTVRAHARRRCLPCEGKAGGRRYPRETVEAMRAIKARGMGQCAMSVYAKHIKMFTRWLWRRKRLTEDPLIELEGATAELDHRHERRPLSENELALVLQTAWVSGKRSASWSGRDRYHIYLAAIYTGFRAEEISYLPPEWFNLGSEPHTIALAGRLAKNGSTVYQPIPAHVASIFADYLKDKPRKQPVWPGQWFRKAAAMLRVDLKDAGIPYTVDGPDGPLYSDFHSLRHSYISLLDKAGVSLKQAMQLARHSDPKLTMRVYGRAQLADLAASAAKLPDVTGGNGSPNGCTATKTGTTKKAQ